MTAPGATAEAPPVAAPAAAATWRRRFDQARAVAAFELLRLRRGQGAVGGALLALLPLLVAVIMSGVLLLRAEAPFTGILVVRGQTRPAAAELETLAFLFRWVNLPFVIYLAAMGLFSNLFRGEIAERTLHHLFLTPVRREAVVLGKYAAACIRLGLLAGGAWIAALVVLLLPHGGSGLTTLVAPSTLGQLGAYLAILALAVLAYGALFLLLGVVFKNPLIVGAVVWLWEWLTRLLPQSFKHFTIIHWLDALMPVRVESTSPLALVAEAEPWLLAVVVLVAVAAAFVLAATAVARRLELAYGSDG